MSLQAEYCVQLLVQFYAELDQRSGWADREKIIAYQQKKGIGAGRTESALQSLQGLKMLDERKQDGASQLKLSQYGLDWFEKYFSLTSRGDNYSFEYNALRKIRLVGPDEFYRTKRQSPTSPSNQINWTKWGAIFAGLGVLVSIGLWKLS